MVKKERETIPTALAAKVLFEADRSCCVCRSRKPVQIHHIDDDPSNNDFTNLAVLCLECHRDTQIRGGFDRKLDAEQVRLYRKDWLEQVREHRAKDIQREQHAGPTTLETRLTIARLNAALANEDWFSVARIYHGVGDHDMRDKYVELALGQEPSPFYEVLLRDMQGRLDEVSEGVKAAAAEQVADDWTTYGGVLADVGKVKEAALAWTQGINESLQSGNWFTAAYYARQLNAQLVTPMFELALSEAAAAGDLWWQVRCFQELGWNDAMRELLLGHEREIRESHHLLLRQELAKAQGDEAELLELTKRIAAAPLEANFSEAQDAAAPTSPL